MRIQAKGGPQVVFAGIVDSGASRTVLSMQDAARLGLDPTHLDDLREAGAVIVADGSAVACLAPLVPIRAQVLGPPASPGDDPRPWGPIFDLDAIFVEHAIPLWGQTDFFDTFGIDFQRPEFTLRY